MAVFGSAILFSTGGVAIKWLTFGIWQVAGFRALFAAIAVWWLVPGPVILNRWAVVLAGAAQGASMLLFVLANKNTTAANAIFLQSAAPLYIPLLASSLLGERTSRRDLFAMAGIAVGLSFFFVGARQPSATAPHPGLGDFFALASGVAWACTVVGLRFLALEDAVTDLDHDALDPGVHVGGASGVVVEAIPAEVADATLADVRAAAPPAQARRGPGGAAKGALIWGNVLVAAVALPLAFPLPSAPASDWALLLYLGVAQIALAYRLLVHAVARIPALEASLLALFEPVLNPVWAFALLGERPSEWALVGAAVLATVTIARAAAGSRGSGALARG